MSQYYIQVWVRCGHPEGCDTMIDLMIPIDSGGTVSSYGALPPGWSHRRHKLHDCDRGSALCPAHGDPCAHTLEQQRASKGDFG